MREQMGKIAPAAILGLVMLWLSPTAGLAVLALGAGLFACTRNPAHTIVLSALSYPAGVWLIDHPGAVWVGLAALAGALLAWLFKADL